MLDWHVKKYGLFGVAFRRGLLIEYGARPVTYIPFAQTDTWGGPNGRVMLGDIESVYTSGDVHVAGAFDIIAAASAGYAGSIPQGAYEPAFQTVRAPSCAPYRSSVRPKLAGERPLRSLPRCVNASLILTVSISGCLAITAFGVGLRTASQYPVVNGDRRLLPCFANLPR